MGDIVPAVEEATAPETGTRPEAILAGAAAAFSEHGFAATSMREIARRSGASLGSIYYHFASKEEILRSLMCENFGRVLEQLRECLAVTDDPRRRLQLFIDNHLRFFARHLAEMRVMSHELDTLGGDAGAQVARLRHRYTEALLGILGQLRPDLPEAELRIRALCLFGMLNWTYRWFHTVDPRIGPSGLAERMTGLYLDGLMENAHVESAS